MSDMMRCPCGNEWDAVEAPPVCPACGADVAARAETLPPAIVPLTLAPDGTAAEPPAPAAVPGYEVLREVGRGGMGVVYEARQLSLGRVVALKMILSGAHAGAAELQRFRSEAQAIARLRHPNIIQIHEVGTHEGRPYFSLEFCAAGSLEQRLRGTPLRPEEAATLIETLARAVHAAHQKGVIHRDLKPANVLLAEDGGPRITDFGLAKAFEPGSDVSPGGLTATNAIMGTPSYMAPEQAAGKARDMGPACDTYALGAILYECLTGRPPFRAATPIDTLRQVIDDEPVAPSRLNPTVPRDLETICLKCLAKVPVKRYGTAEELADDLARWRRGEPIRARPLSSWERSVRWVRRHRLATAIMVQTAALMLALVAVFAFYQIRETNSARDSLKQVQAEREQAQDALARGHYEQARALLRSREPGRRWAALELLAKAEHLRGRERQSDVVDPAAAPLSRAELRREAATALLTEDAREVGTIPVAFPLGLFSAVAPDASWLMTQFIRQPEKPGDQASGGLRLFDLRDGRRIAEVQGIEFFNTRALAVSPDAKIVARIEVGGAIRLTEFPSGKAIRALTRPPLPKELSALPKGSRSFVTFSPDARRLLAGDISDKASDIYVWDLAEPGQPRHLARVPAFVPAVHVRPDGGAVAIPMGGSRVGIWDFAKGGAPAEIDMKLGVALDSRLAGIAAYTQNALLWSPDGRRLAAAARDSGKFTIAVVDVATQAEQLRWESPQPADALALAFAPDGRRLYTGDGTGAVHCLDLDTRQEAWWLEGVSPMGVHILKCTRDGRLIAGGMIANQLRVLEPSRDRFERPIGRADGPVGDIAFHPSGKRLAVQGAGQDRVVRFLPLAGDEGEWSLPVPAEAVDEGALRFRSDGRELAVFCRETAVVFDLEQRRETRRLAGPKQTGPFAGRTNDARLLPDGRIVDVVSEGAEKVFRVTVRDRATGKGIAPVLELPRAPGIAIGPFGDSRTYRLSADGRLLAVSPFPFMPSRESVTVWNLDTGTKVAEVSVGDESVMSMQAQLSPDSRWLLRITMPYSFDTGAVKGSDMRLHVWETATGRPAWQIVCPFPPSVTAFSADGRLLAVGYEYGGVDLFDAQTGEQLFRWRPPGLREVQRLAFSPDASLLAAAGKGGPVRLLHLSDLRKRLAEMGLDW